MSSDMPNHGVFNNDVASHLNRSRGYILPPGRFSWSKSRCGKLKIYSIIVTSLARCECYTPILNRRLAVSIVHLICNANTVLAIVKEMTLPVGFLRSYPNFKEIVSSRGCGEKGAILFVMFAQAINC